MKNIKIKCYIGEDSCKKHPMLIKYDPYEDAVILRSADDKETEELWLSADCIEEMVDELKEFSEALKAIRKR